jgi:hypothetical protein
LSTIPAEHDPSEYIKICAQSVAQCLFAMHQFIRASCNVDNSMGFSTNKIQNRVD